MEYDKEFMKGITYGDMQGLFITASGGAFLEFIEEFKDLTEQYARDRLEDFISDHSPEDSIIETDSDCCKSSKSLSDFLIEWKYGSHE